MSQRRDIRVPIRDKPCLASATTTYGRVQFNYDASGFLTQLRFYGEDLVGLYFDLNFDVDASGFVRDIIRVSY